MVPHPRALDNNAAVIVHAPSRNSKQSEIDDLVIAQCMAHRKGYFRNDHALKPRMDMGGEEAQKPAIGCIN